MTIEWKNDLFAYKYEFDAHWMMVYRYSPRIGFFNHETAKLSFEKDKFSYMGRISDIRYVRRYNESYEFLLEYPVECPGEYNRWLQSKDPLEEQDKIESGLTATGFMPINLSWPAEFGGLMKSIRDSSLLDGNTGHYFWDYAIGDTSGDYYPLTPGPKKGSTYVYVSFVQLWIRIREPFVQRLSCSSRQSKTHSVTLAVMLVLG